MLYIFKFEERNSSEEKIREIKREFEEKEKEFRRRIEESEKEKEELRERMRELERIN